MGKLPNILKSIYKIHPTAVGCGVCYWAKRRDLFHYSCHQFLNWWPQQSTGLLHLMVQIPLLFSWAKNNTHPFGWVLFFGGEGGI